MAPKLPRLDARIHQWDFDRLIERNCPICGSADAQVAFVERPDGLGIRTCGKCHALYVSPAPSSEQLEAFYGNYDAKHRRASRINAGELASSYQEANPLADLRIRELSSLMKIESSRVLDIGFGRAHFLYCLKKLGAIPLGLELDAQAVEFARFLGIDVLQGNLADLADEPKFDLITLLDLVEHPLDPMTMLRKSSELLRRRGLLMIWTPNGDYADPEKSQTTFRVDLEHMQYITPRACLYIASELKLDIIHLETLGFPALKGIDKPVAKDEVPASLLKRRLKSIPGFAAVNRIRRRLFGGCRAVNRLADERMGSYNLFCILQKP